MKKRLSTGGLARASAAHPWRVLGGWLAVVVIAAAAVVALLGGALTTDDDFTNNPESKRAEALLDRAFARQGGLDPDEAVVVRSATLTVDQPAFRQRVEELLDGIRSLNRGTVVAGATAYYDDRDEELVSPDRRTTLLLLDVRDEVEPLTDFVLAENGRLGFDVLATGEESVDADFERTAEQDLQRAELYGLGLALVILFVVFGAFVASLVPILVALCSILVALGLTALVGQAFTLSFFVVNMLVMMGLAVGIDYSLFVLSRFREERARGRDQLDAIATAGATATRAVVFSGFAVVLGLAGMLLVPQTIFRSLATGAILVVLTSVLAALTLLPAMLGVLGDRVDALRLPFRRRRTVGDGGWTRITESVMRRPLASLLACVAVLGALAVPYLGIQLGSSGVSTLPDSFQSKQAFDVVEEEFGPQRTSTVLVAVEGDTGSPEVRGAVERLQQLLADDPRFGDTELAVSADREVASLSVAVDGDPLGTEAIDAVRDLRGEYIPNAFAGVPAQALVAGESAGELDFYDIAAHYQPLVFAFVLGLSFLLLVFAFRSLVVPATAIATNLLSVGAAYGLLVLVFQHGVGAGLLGFEQVDVVEAWLPLFLFSVLFGLSMDYHVFLLSRIRERYEETGDTGEAVAFGVRSTARIITGAALIMVAVFAGFASGELVMFQQMGFGLAAAVLIDATVVRTVLVPAAMKLLGRWNWYLPRRLHRLPELRAEAAAE